MDKADDSTTMHESNDYDTPDLDDDEVPSDNTIHEASDDLLATTAKTARLTRRLQRALAVAESANDASADAYASVVVLSDHAKAGPASANDRARRASNHTSAVRSHAAAIVTAVRAVARLDTGLERFQVEISTGASIRNALETAIQADDGDLDHTSRQSAQQRRADFDEADTAAADTLATASALRISFTDPRPTPNSNPILEEFIS